MTHGGRNFIRFAVFLSGIIAPSFAFAQPRPQLSFCLSRAADIELSAYKAEQKYIEKPDDLRTRLSKSCASLEYQITARGQVLRIVSEYNGEIWSINEHKILAPLSQKTGSHPLPPPAAPPLVPRSLAAVSPSPAPHPAVRDTPTAYLPGAPPPGGPSFAIAAAPEVAAAPVPAPLPGAVAGTRAIAGETNMTSKMNKCFSRSQFTVTECTTFFADVKKRCRVGAPEPKPVICTDFVNSMNTLDLSECKGASENWGRCELRHAQLAKSCVNSLSRMTGECRDYYKYFAERDGLNWEGNDPTPRLEDSETEGDSEAQSQSPANLPPGAICGKGTRQSCAKALCTKAAAPDASKTDFALCAEAQGLQSGSSAQRYIDEVRPIENSLATLMRLRPSTYAWKDSHLRDLGFVAEEVEAVDPMLVTYSEKGALQGIKYTQMSALLTSGLQELHGVCKANADVVRELASRLKVIEKENADLKKRLEIQSNVLESIKAKLGVN